jgi:hypothetical protein
MTAQKQGKSDLWHDICVFRWNENKEAEPKKV